MESSPKAEPTKTGDTSGGLPFLPYSVSVASALSITVNGRPPGSPFAGANWTKYGGAAQAAKDMHRTPANVATVRRNLSNTETACITQRDL